MKTTPFCIGLLTFLLVACDKERPAASEAPKRPSLAERKEAKRKEIAARPPVEEPVEEVLPPPVTPPPSVQPQAPIAKTPPAVAPSATTAPSDEERQAQRAEAMAQRVAQMTEQINTRMMENDANGDGLLTKDEMAGPMQRGFERMDGNGDGAIDATEREAMIKGMADRMSQFTRDRGRGQGRGPGGPGRGGNDRRRD
jgi:hypothetical protein